MQKFNEFFKDTQKEINEAIKENNKKAIESVVYSYDMIVDLSPKHTGLFSNNHFITENSTTNEVIDKTLDKSQVKINAIPKINKLKFNNNDKIVIQNNLSYASALEAGHSKQATGGVYGITREKTKDFIKDLARK